jgi:flavin reductase (DIM6/NTAB) family NADH-FMN oxidoreductase RutF
MNDVPVRRASTGAPLLEGAVAWIDCEIRHTLPLGSHSWFVGEVVDVGAVEAESPVDDDGRVLRMEDTRMNYGG